MYIFKVLFRILSMELLLQIATTLCLILKKNAVQSRPLVHFILPKHKPCITFNTSKRACYVTFHIIIFRSDTTEKSENYFCETSLHFKQIVIERNLSFILSIVISATTYATLAMKRNHSTVNTIIKEIILFTKYRNAFKREKGLTNERPITPTPLSTV